MSSASRAIRSRRSVTTTCCSPANRSRWCSPKRSKPPALLPASSRSTMMRRHTTSTSTHRSPRSSCRPRACAATPIIRPSPAATRVRRSRPRRSRCRASTASPPSTTTRWRCTPPPSSGTATARSPSMTRSRVRRTRRPISLARSSCPRRTSASSTPMSAAASARGCGRNGRCSSRRWARSCLNGRSASS